MPIRFHFRFIFISLGLVLPWKAFAVSASQIDTTFQIRATAVVDTVFVTIDWYRKEKDKVDIRVDVLDMAGTLVKSFSQKMKVGSFVGGRARFVIPALATELGDSTSFYYGVSANPSCNCEEILKVVLPMPIAAYTLPEPNIKYRITKHNKKVYIALVTEQLALDVTLTLPKGNPAWKLETNHFDLLPGQDLEVEIIGMAQSDAPRIEDVGVNWQK